MCANKTESYYAYVIRNHEGKMEMGVIKGGAQCPLYVNGCKVIRCIETDSQIASLEAFSDMLKDCEILEMFEKIQL